jgi:hypothetical protein
MKSVLILLFGLLFNLQSAQASQDGWSHITLHNSGTNINIDYVIQKTGGGTYKPDYFYFSSPLYINVSGSQLTGQEKVRVVLNNHPATYGSAPVTYTLDLIWHGDHFSGELDNAEVNQGHLKIGKGKFHPLLVRRDGYGGAYTFEQDMAVAIDGRWIKNGPHNFEVRLFPPR